MVFGSVAWSRVRKTGNRGATTKCCAISWSSQRHARKGKEGKSARHAEPKTDEKTIDFDLFLNEINGNEEEENAVVFTENSNFSSRYSVKLKTRTTYSFKLSMDQNLTLKYIKLKDHRFELCEKESEFADDGKKVHTFIWSTNDVPKTKNNKRFILSATMKIEGYKKFKFDMLVKFYRDEERRVYDGIQLSSIGLEFIVPQDPTVPHYDPEGDDSDSEDEPGSKFHLINDMDFKSNGDEE